jgi:hypothetical protein
LSDSIDDVFEAHSARGNAAALDAFLAFSFAASAAASSAAPSATPSSTSAHIGQFADRPMRSLFHHPFNFPRSEHILIEAQFTSKRSVYTAHANLVYVDPHLAVIDALDVWASCTSRGRIPGTTLSPCSSRCLHAARADCSCANPRRIPRTRPAR